MPSPKKQQPAAASKATPKVKKAAAPKRTRRMPYDMLKDLKAKRDALAAKMAERIGALDRRIADLEAKHAERIRVSELIQSKTAEELEAEATALKTQLSLLKRARKMVGAGK